MTDQPSSDEEDTPQPALISSYEFDIALSFADAQRPFVEKVAKILEASGLKVYYYVDEQGREAGKDLRNRTEEVYGKSAATVAVFTSAAYAKGPTALHELRVAAARHVREKGREFLLTFRFDDTPVQGMPSGLIYPYLEPGREAWCAQDLIERLATMGITPTVSRMPYFEWTQGGYNRDQVYGWIDRYRSGKLVGETPTLPLFEWKKSEKGLNRNQVDRYVQQALQVQPDPLFQVDGFDNALRDICRLGWGFETDPPRETRERARDLGRIPDSEQLRAVCEHRQKYYSTVQIYTESIVLTSWGLRVFNEAYGHNLGVRYSDIAEMRIKRCEDIETSADEFAVPHEVTYLQFVYKDAHASLLPTPALHDARHRGIRDVIEKVRNLAERTLEFPAAHPLSSKLL